MRRRSFIAGLAAALAAPALVRSQSLEATLLQPSGRWIWTPLADPIVVEDKFGLVNAGGRVFTMHYKIIQLPDSERQLGSWSMSEIRK